MADLCARANWSGTIELRLAASGLFEEILNKGADLRVLVTGHSMTPFLRSHDIVTIEAVVHGTLNRGDIILYKDDHGLPVIHRIIRIRSVNGKSAFLVTKGDALKTCDAPIDSSRVIGRIIRVEKPALPTLNLKSRIFVIVNRVIALVQNSKPGVTAGQSHAGS